MAKLDGRMDKLDSRMDKLDSRMDKLDSRMDKLEERQTKAEVVLENVIVPRLDALAEGQKNLLETLAPKSRVETLEEEISILRMAVRTLASDVNELNKRNKKSRPGVSGTRTGQGVEIFDGKSTPLL